MITLFKKSIPALVMLCALYIYSCKEQRQERNGEGEEKPVKERRGLFKDKSRKPLKVIIENLGEGSGPVRLGVYGPDNDFPNKDAKLSSYQFIPKNGKAEGEIDDLEYGELAIAVYHDVNDNKEIDKNGIGIPTEPYGFSNDFKPVMKAPEFKDCSFAYNEKSNRIVISLNNKKEEKQNEKNN